MVDITDITSALLVVIGLVLIVVLTFRVVQQTDRGLVERFGKFNRYAEPGLHILIPLVERLTVVNITEQMVDADKQEIITKDNLNATVDAQVYFRIKADKDNVMKSVYSVDKYRYQIVNLARTTLRNIIGNLTLTESNSERNRINSELLGVLASETTEWGIDIVRTELKEIQPPADVQDAMNRVVKAENEKLAAKDYATAAETQADGIKRAAIKEAEGEMRSQVLRAEGKAKAIELEYTAAQTYFKEEAQVLKKLETVVASLEGNTKIVLPVEKGLVNIISDMAGITPIPAIPEYTKPTVEDK